MALGLPEILVLGSIVILISGRKKIPNAFSDLGKSFKSFKSGLEGEEDERPVREVEELAKAKDPSQKTKP